MTNERPTRAVPRWAGRLIGAISLGAAAVLAAAGLQAAPPTPDPVGELIRAAQASYQHVRDYTCTFVKQERVDGKLWPEQVAQMRVRTKPFSVHFKFVAPANIAGQEAVYVEGKNNNQIRARSSGLLAAVGFISLDPRDPRVMQGNRHTIQEAGIGNLIERIAASHATQSKLNGTRVNLADYLFNRRVCTRFEAIHANRQDGVYAYRCVTYFDKETKLPVRFEAFDWPKPGGDPNGELLEVYNYLDIRYNVGLGDKAFDF